MATCRPGDAIISPPAAICGHVPHHAAGCAGLYGLTTPPAPVDADGYTVDLAALRKLAKEVRLKLITQGGNTEPFPYPVDTVRENTDARTEQPLFEPQHQYNIII